MLNNRKNNYVKRKIMYIMVIFIFLLAGCSNNKEVTKIDDETLNGEFFENQTIDLLEIQNFFISSFDDSSYISFDVMNKGESTYINSIKILGYDIDNNLIIELYGYVGQELDKDISKHIEIEVDINLSSINYLRYERV